MISPNTITGSILVTSTFIIPPFQLIDLIEAVTRKGSRAGAVLWIFYCENHGHACFQVFGNMAMCHPTARV